MSLIGLSSLHGCSILCNFTKTLSISIRNSFKHKCFLIGGDGAAAAAAAGGGSCMVVCKEGGAFGRGSETANQEAALS